MKKGLVFLLIALGICCFMSSYLSAADIYVDNGLAADITDGSYSIINRDNGGSDGNAYRTIQLGVNVMSAGDTLYIRGGTYRGAGNRQIDIHSKDDGSAENKYTIKSYPGEWAILDGQHSMTGNLQCIIYSLNHTVKYWVFENMEITGGGPFTEPTSDEHGSGILLDSGTNCQFRYLYIHDNYGDTHPGAAAGLQLQNESGVAPHENIIEYCYFKCNGNPFGDHNTANANIAIYSDYKYSNTVDTSTCMHNNIIQYNLIDGSCNYGFIDVGVMNKGFQRLTGYRYGETENSNDNQPNNFSYRNYGDKIHHNIIKNHCMGMRADQDYTQFFNNIVWLSNNGKSAENTCAWESRDSCQENRGSYYPCVYNNTIYADLTSSLRFFVLYTNYWDCSVHGNSSETDYVFAVNNLISHDNSSTFSAIYVGPDKYHAGVNCDAPKPINMDHLNLSRNFYYSCTGTNLHDIGWGNKYTELEIEATAAADNVFVKSTPSPFLGSVEPNKYKTFGSYILQAAPEKTLADGGLGGSHPYLSGTTIPSYIGATNPNDNVWVEGVLGLNVAYMKNATGDPAWIEGVPPSVPPSFGY